ncbi:MAG: hypothetical protein QOE59_2104 [Actinomycetota bacterium]|nr:hypothetical protein [Actinomycetota bacterium]
MTSAVRDRPPSPDRPPGGPGPSRLRLVLAAVLAGAVIVLPLVLLAGKGSEQAAPPPLATPAPGRPAATTSATTATVDPVAAGRALAAKPATGSGVLDSSVGDFASHFDNSGNAGLVDGAPRPQVVAGPAFAFTVPGGGKRAEVLPRVPEYHEGDDLWVHDVSTLHNVPTGTGTWQLVLQWHQLAGTGSPPIALEVGGGRLRLANVGADQQDVGPLGPNDTFDVVLHIHFSRDPGRAVVDVWRDGVPKVVNYHPPQGTLLDGGDYLKLGLYRDPAITQPSSMTTTRFVVGPTDASINATGITPR